MYVDGIQFSTKKVMKRKNESKMISFQCFIHKDLTKIFKNKTKTLSFLELVGKNDSCLISQIFYRCQFFRENFY